MDSIPPKYEFAFKKSNLMIFTFRLVLVSMAHIIYSCLSVRLSVCLSVRNGSQSHGKRFDLEPSYAMSLATEHLKLKRGGFCGRQPWYRLQAETTAY